jgi:hypothetical protein
MLLTAERIQLIKQLNGEPLCAAAGQHLPPDFQCPSTEIYLISLARLGLEHRVGRFRDPDEEELETAINYLSSADPVWALEYMTTDEGGEPLLLPEAFVGVDADSAMFLVLEALHDSKASR